MQLQPLTPAQGRPGKKFWGVGGLPGLPPTPQIPTQDGPVIGGLCLTIHMIMKTVLGSAQFHGRNFTGSVRDWWSLSLPSSLRSSFRSAAPAIIPVLSSPICSRPSFIPSCFPAASKMSSPTGIEVWLIKPPQLVEGRRILIVDEICSTGQTLSIAKEDVIGMGAFSVKSAVLYSHTKGAAIPDYIGLISDALDPDLVGPAPPGRMGTFSCIPNMPRPLNYRVGMLVRICSSIPAW